MSNISGVFERLFKKANLLAIKQLKEDIAAFADDVYKRRNDRNVPYWEQSFAVQYAVQTGVEGVEIPKIDYTEEQQRLDMIEATKALNVFLGAGK